MNDYIYFLENEDFNLKDKSIEGLFNNFYDKLPNKYIDNNFLWKNNYGHICCLIKNIFGNKEEFVLIECNKKNSNKYKCKFVGLFVINNIIFVSLPKHIKFYKNTIDDNIKYNETIQLFKLIHKYHNALLIRDSFYSTCYDAFSKIVAAYRLGCIYLEKGLYFTKQTEYSFERGNTLWGRTSSSVCPDLINGSPIYRRTIKYHLLDDTNIITDIQKSVLHYLFIDSYLGLLCPFKIDIEPGRISYDDLLQNKTYYIQLLKEHQITIYDDSFYEMFDIIISLLDDNNSYYNSKQNFYTVSDFQCYGLMKYENLFELMLSDYFGNQISLDNIYDNSGKNLLRVHYNHHFEDINRVNRYSYHIREIKNEKIINERDNKNILIPDIVFDNFTPDCINNICVIADAKYYDKDCYPRYYDIYKQYLYEYLLDGILKTITDQIKDYKIFNCFIMNFIVYDDNTDDSIPLFQYLGYISCKGAHAIPVLGCNLSIFSYIISSTHHYNIEENKRYLISALQCIYEYINNSNVSIINNTIHPITILQCKYVNNSYIIDSFNPDEFMK